MGGALRRGTAVGKAQATADDGSANREFALERCAMNSSFSKATFGALAGPLAAVSILLGGMASAQEPQDKATCLSDSKIVPPDLRVRSCSAVIQSGKDDARTLSSALTYRAISFIQKNGIDRAIADIDQAIRIDPNNARAFNGRGFIFLTKGELDRALSDLNEAVRLDPNLGDALVNRSVLYIQRDDFDRAIVDLNEALRINPRNAAAFYNRGFAYRTKGDLD